MIGKKKPKEAWEHPSPGKTVLLAVTEGERVKRYHCDKAMSESDNVALYAGGRFLALVPKTSDFNYE